MTGHHERADVLEQCLSGLGVAHQAGLVHRDVKPGNILLEAGTGRALLADFGLAKLVGAGAGLTRTGVVVGTVSYLSPEQARGEKVDHRSDLYSLGVVAYQMLSGRLPFESDTPSRMLFQHAYETPRPLQEVAPEVPAALAAVVTRLLAKEPACRYSSSAEALSDLRHGRSQAAPVPSPEREAVAQGSPGRPPAPPRGEDRTEALPVAPPRLGRRRLVLLGAVALLLLAGGLTVWLWPRRGPDERGEPGGDSPPVAGGAPAPAGRAEGAGAPRPEDNSDGKVPPLVVPDPLRVPQPAAVRDRPLAVCSGHGQAVLSVAVSPERRYLLSGSKDKSTRLWDGKTGKLLRSSTEPTYWVLALAFSPDGQLAVSPRDPSALRVWEVESGKERCQFTGHKSSVRSAVFSADGRYVFSGGPLRGLFLWDVTNGKMVRNFVGQPQDVTCVAMSQDSRWALSGGCAGSLVLWDLEAGKGRPLAGHPGSCLVGVGFCANDRVVSADGTRMIRVWDRGGRLLRQIEVQCDGPVQQAAFSPRGDRALCACDDGTLRLLDLNNGKEIACLRGHPGGVMAVAFSPDGRLAASGGNDCIMRLWELPR
ncbi:MAG TPA: protein kinase [Gemmataceae bacterium]|nr:protein kinase [Gemmataceae bacterium]